MTKCPYCGGKKIKPPKVMKWETPSFAHGICPCGKHPRATVSWGNDGTMYISYSRDGRKALPEEERKSVHVQGMLSPRDITDLVNGRKSLRLDRKTKGGYTVKV